MLTQRERINIMTPKIKKHNFFEGPYKLTREEAALVLYVFGKRQKILEKQHERYVANQDELRAKGRARYAEKKDTINEMRRQKRLQEVIEGAFK